MFYNELHSNKKPKSNVLSNSMALDTQVSSSSYKQPHRVARSSTKLNITKVFDIKVSQEEENPLAMIEEKNLESVLIKHWQDPKMIQIHMIFSEDMENSVQLDHLGFIKEEHKSELSQNNILTEDDISLDKNDMGEPQQVRNVPISNQLLASSPGKPGVLTKYTKHLTVAQFYNFYQYLKEIVPVLKIIASDREYIKSFKRK